MTDDQPTSAAPVVMSWEDYNALDQTVVRHVGDECEVVEAGDRIAISLDLLRGRHSCALQVLGDADLVIICGEYRYRATGRVTSQGDPEYTLEARP